MLMALVGLLIATVGVDPAAAPRGSPSATIDLLGGHPVRRGDDRPVRRRARCCTRSGWAPRRRSGPSSGNDDQPGGPAPVPWADPARQLPRLPPRHPARRRLDAGLLHGLRRREAGQQARRRVRERRDRGRGRPESREQRGSQRQLRPDPDAGHPGRRDDRRAARRVHDLRNPARAPAVREAARPGLGPAGVVLHRQRDAAGAQPAAGARCSRRSSASPTATCTR